MRETLPTDIEMKILLKLANYNRTDKGFYSNDSVWQTSTHVTKDITDINHRTYYLKDRLHDRFKVLNVKKVRYTKGSKGDKRPQSLYKIKSDFKSAKKIFYWFYHSKYRWKYVKSTYFNDTWGNLAKNMLISSHFNFMKNTPEISSKRAKKYHDEIHQNLLIPPSLFYLFTENKLKEMEFTEITLKDIFEAFLIHDYVECDDPEIKVKLKESLIYIRNKKEAR